MKNYAKVLENNKRLMKERREAKRRKPKVDTIVAVGYAERQIADSLAKAGKVNTEL
jgi:Holliday junction resolvasome RuvABC DNA-binding subunit